MKYSTAAAAAALLSFGSIVNAGAPTSKQCIPNYSNACYTLNIPETTANSGSGDIYFQISGPTSFGWMALGQGTGMAGANIFVIYQSANGQNVTLSPRSGTGHVMPMYNSNAQVSLLEGSGVANGIMTANVKCSNCDSWSGGSMDFTSASASWIYAYGSGSSVMSDSPQAAIQQHSFNAASSFTWVMSSAKGGNDVNPFVQAAVTTPATTGGSSSTPSESGSATATGTATTTSGVSTTTVGGTLVCTPDANSTYGGPPFGPPKKRDACPEGTSPVDSSGSTIISNNAFNPVTFDRVATIHGCLAGIAFVGLFPVGGILIRLGNFTNLVWIHAAMQMLAYAIYAAAFAMGIWLVRTLQPSSHAHPFIGGVIFLVLLSQPLTGFLHHRGYLRSGGRTRATRFHLVIGRAAIILGMLNGGLGLHLAGEEGGSRIAYGVCAVVMAIAYIASIVIGERRRRRREAVAFGGVGGAPGAFASNPRMDLSRDDGFVQNDVNLERIHVDTQVPKYN